MSKWMVSSKKCDFKQIGDELGIDQVVVRVMRNRDMTDISQMKIFLNGSEEIFHSYEYMKDVDKAVDILYIGDSPTTVPISNGRPKDLSKKEKKRGRGR